MRKKNRTGTSKCVSDVVGVWLCLLQNSNNSVLFKLARFSSLSVICHNKNCNNFRINSHIMMVPCTTFILNLGYLQSVIESGIRRFQYTGE